MAKYNDSKRPLTTAELIEVIENLDEDELVPDKITIFPPENNGEDTDMDSGDEESNDPDHLNHNQLSAGAEFSYDTERIIEEVEERTEETSEKENSIMPMPKRYKSTTSKCIWQKRDLQIQNQITWTEYLPVITLTKDSSSLEFFELFLTPDIIEDLVKNTVMYAAQKNARFELSSSEMYVFIGILLLSGYVPLPRRRMFWEENEDVHNTLVSQSMRRNKFEEIFRYFHVADNNNLQKNDKMAKIRPLIVALNKKFITNAPIQPEVSIDESMIPYYGRHGCKQFIKSKPIRFGYKAWVLALRLGYCIQFDIYQGRKVDEKKEVDTRGLGESVVMNFSDILKEHYSDLQFSLFFDNFFTSAKLIRSLSEFGYGGTGTVRENRTDKCILKDAKKMKKDPRGEIDCAVDKENQINAIRWRDNNIVTMLSNKYGVHPIQKCQRYSAKEKTRITISQPNCITEYNKYMGGVDQLDNNVSNYCISMRGKKWYIPIVYWLFDVCMINAWQLSRAYGKNLDNLQFRREVVQHLLLKYGKKSDMPGPKRQSIVNPEIASGRHIIITQQLRRRCALCKNKTTKACASCNVPIHDKCFEEYHNK